MVQEKGKTSFTAVQEKAINDHGRDILVSASAGSGKTTVLVQRLMKEILSGVSVDQLLVVTFTKAAAAEMKKRIKEVLSNEIQKSSNNSYLRQQLNLLDSANISTIDAFCLDVIHRFYYIINIDPSFSILTDDSQAELMRERALKEVEGEFLEKKDKDFIAFYDNFAGDRDAESPQNLLLDLYNYAMAKPDYRQWLQGLAQKYQMGEEVSKSSLWQKEIKPYLVDLFQNLADKLEHMCQSAVMATKELHKLKESFDLFAKCLSGYLHDLKNDSTYDDQREKLRACIFRGNPHRSKKWDEDIIAFYDKCSDFKKEARDQIFTAFTSFYATDEKEQLSMMQKGQQIMTAVVKAELALIDRFNELKRAENLLDFSDMEQLAYQILSQDTSASQMARTFYQNKFNEILVDEYQDINPLQENILQLIKKDGQNNLFMVGDVKQSIYGFRQAEPSLFLHKYQEAALKENQAKEERILLSDNFRSTKPVISIVNQVFKNILTADFGGIDYNHESQLTYGAKYYPSNLPDATEILFHEKNNNEKSSQDEDPDDIDSAEIAMVINRINKFAEENLLVYDKSSPNSNHLRPFKYSDIVILTRSRSNNLEIMQEFAKSHIPIMVTDAKNYFQTLELTIIMNYLRIIDNPDQDIPLVAVLRSPLFNFTEPELSTIRIHTQNASFYNALTSYVAVGDELSQKVKDFLNQLEELRKFAATHRISELIWSIYEKTSLLEIMTSLPNGKQRRVNLEALYERAASYESAGFKGLYQFINFIERMRRSQKDLAQPLLTKEAGNSVRLMTVHSSKGLEFPVVFYLGLQHQFQKRDLSGNYIINSGSVGLTIKLKHYRADTLVKAIANISKKRQLLEEEARILYVGMTRAKQKLILVADLKKLPETIKNWQNEADQNGRLSLNSKLNASNPMSLIGPSIKWDKLLSQKINDINSALETSQELLYIQYQGEKVHLQEYTSPEENKTEDISSLEGYTEKLFNFSYPFQDASQTTAYQSVSEIKKAFNDPLDTELENAHLISSTNRYLQPIDTKPDFLFKTRFTGAEIGTAMHLILQYYDYHGSGAINQVKEEVQELVEQNKLNNNIVSSLDLEKINWFVHSDFAKKFWQKPENLHREIEFSSLLPADSLFDNFSDADAKILIHGTIDGYFTEKDGIILFDYKTDHIDQTHLELAIKNIKQKYLGQLRLYERALNSFADKKVKAKYLVLLDACKIVELN